MYSHIAHQAGVKIYNRSLDNIRLKLKRVFDAEVGKEYLEVKVVFGYEFLLEYRNRNERLVSKSHHLT